MPSTGLSVCRQVKKYYEPPIEKPQCVFIKLFTCSFDDLPHGRRCGRHHGSLVQAQLPDIHNMETVHVFLWSDGVTHCTLVDVL